MKGAYIIKCDEVVKDARGSISHLVCSVDLDSRSGSPGADRKVKGTLQWVSAEEAVPLEARLYEPLLKDDDEISEDTDRKDFISRLNKDSLTVEHGYAEPAVLDSTVGDTFQFLRVGYFCKDKDSTDSNIVFNRVVSLKDSYRP